MSVDAAGDAEDGMSISDRLTANNAYAASFSHGELGSPPVQHLAVVTCMDARIDPAAALGLSPGDAHVIRNAGGVVTGDVLRSLVVSHRLLGTREVMVIGHTECGMQTFSSAELRRRLVDETGADPEEPATFAAFEDVRESVAEGVQLLADHPWLDVTARGFVYDVRTGRLEAV